VEAAFCDERGEHGFSWTVDEPATRTSHALVDDGRVWLVDAVDWSDAIERAAGAGEPAAVVQLLDRHNRDCAAIAERLGVPHLVVPDELGGSPFELVPVRESRLWRERALWWPAARTLVVAEALGTNGFFTGGRGPVGVHLLMRLKPPRPLAGFAPEHLLVGHGAGLHGPETPAAIREALRTSRRGLVHVLTRLPAYARDARARRRRAG
jgi:hypothetical protein